jgi:hypothetical protein
MIPYPSPNYENLNRKLFPEAQKGIPRDLLPSHKDDGVMMVDYVATDRAERHGNKKINFLNHE